MNEGRKTGRPNMAIEIGAFATFLVSGVGSGLELLRDSTNGGAWFAFVTCSVAWLLCIPLLVSAFRNRPPSQHDE
jgi:hypothetical protein